MDIVAAGQSRPEFPDEVVRVQGLRKNFGSRQTLAGLDFSVRQGECFGILGPNGAGKTTAIRILIGLVRRTAGEVALLGLDVDRHGPAIRARIGVVPQNDNLDTDLSVEENLLTYASYFGIPRREARAKAQELLDFFAMKPRRGELIDRLSGGQRRRLLLARALMHGPEILILDEPTVGLDPQARHLMWTRLRTLRANGVTMILTSHYMEEVAQLCGRILVLDHGRLVVEGDPQTLVREMVGVDVFEIQGDAAELAQHEQCATECGARVERFAETLYVYASQDCPVLAEALRGARFWLRRPANLEDLFIHLTGRRLRE